jgi:hypothetical protein
MFIKKGVKLERFCVTNLAKIQNFTFNFKYLKLNQMYSM